MSHCATIPFAGRSALIGLILSVLAPPVFSQESDDENVSEFETPLGIAVYEPLLGNSPFTRPINLSSTLTLTGVAVIDGETIATLIDRETSTSYVLSEEPNAEGWRVIEYLGGNGIEQAKLQISVGGEVVSVRYDPDATVASLSSDKDSSRKDSRSRGGGGGPFGSDPKTAEKYSKLSDSGRQQLREYITKNRESIFNKPPEERSRIINQVIDKLGRNDSKSSRR